MHDHRFAGLAPALALTLLIALGVAVPTTVASAATGPKTWSGAHRCVTEAGDPCRTAKQYKRAFKRGDMGHSTHTKRKFPKAFKAKLRKVVIRKGLIPPPHRRVSAEERGGYRYDGFGDYWDAFNNVIDCVAPGAESACKEDFDEIKPLEEPAKLVVGCGGLAVIAFYTGGTSVPATAAVAGGLGCGWSLAIAAW